MRLDEVVSAVAGVAATEAAEKAMLGEIGLGQIDKYILDAMGKFFDKYGPQIAGQFSALAEPAAKKASEIIGPVVEQKLRDYGPTFALITGGVLAGAYILGNILARREVRRAKGRRSAA